MHQTIDTIARILTFVTQTFDKIGAWIVLPAISVVMMTDVILRYVFNSPLIWGLEFGEWMLLFIFVAAIPECTRRHGTYPDGTALRRDAALVPESDHGPLCDHRRGPVLAHHPGLNMTSSTFPSGSDA